MGKEYFDVLDENGIKTGETRPREEVHKMGFGIGGPYLDYRQFREHSSSEKVCDERQ